MHVELGDDSIHDTCFALRHAIVRMSDDLRAGLNNGHPDRNSIDWWDRFEGGVEKIKLLRNLLDQLEGPEE